VDIPAGRFRITPYPALLLLLLVRVKLPVTAAPLSAGRKILTFFNFRTGSKQ